MQQCRIHESIVQVLKTTGLSHAGDPLSPLIFTICLDPLLKWLESGDRGYNTKIQANDNELYISSLAYADDMTITSSTTGNTQRQLNKLSAYCKWMGLRVNALKCQMHIVKWTEPNPFNTKQLQAVRREASGKADDGRNIGPGIHINGPFGPLTIPYRGLQNGVHVFLMCCTSHGATLR